MDRRTFNSILFSASARAQQGAKPALPTAEQAAWQDMELEMFIHFAPNTWQDQEYDDLSTPLDRINPAKLDVEQWVDAAVSMGAGQIVFVAKHTGGFCWWQTGTTRYSVKHTPWRGGKGDVMADLSRACRRRGIKLGVYLSPQDKFSGTAVSGRSSDPEVQRKYDAIYRQQLRELLSRYGDIHEVWFDGSLVVDVGDILRRHAPGAMVFQGPHATIRWVGNEMGFAPYPAWNAVPAEAARSGVATAKDGTPDGEVWLPNECDARIRKDWFWNSKNADSLKPVEQLMLMYYRSVGHGAVLLLNNTPDRSGLIPESDMKRTAEFGAEVRRRFGKSLAQTAGEGPVVELDPGRTIRIDHVVTMEDIRGGERVREYRIEALAGSEWRELARGTAIGHKKIDPLPALEVRRVRLRVEESAGTPRIRKLAIYHSGDADPARQQVATYAAIVLKTYGPRDLADDWISWKFDLAPHCRDAGQYEFDVLTTGGPLQVRGLTLVAGGVEAPEFVTPAERPGAWTLNITGLGAKLELAVQVKARRGREAHGQLVIRRLF